MSTTALKPVTTPIPVQLSEPEFEAFILPHLSMPKRGPKCKLGYYGSLTSSSGSSTRGCSGSACPYHKTPTANRPFITPPSTKSSLGGRMMGRCGRRLWPAYGIWRQKNTSTPACCMATGPTPWPKKGRWHRVLGTQTSEGGESYRHHRQSWLCLSACPRGSRE